MKSCVIVALAVAVGFDLVAANTVKKTVDKDLSLSESNDSSTNPSETLSNNSQKEQEKIETKNGDAVIEDQTQEITLEIDIEENIQSPLDNFDFQEAIDNELGLEEFNNDQFNLEENVDTTFENEFEIVKADDYVYSDVIYKDPDEVMETAAGFVPVPIIRKRKKQTPRRRVPTRRYNRRPYASRRHYYFYPYYRYYRPSSLRYYSYY